MGEPSYFITMEQGQIVHTNYLTKTERILNSSLIYNEKKKKCQKRKTYICFQLIFLFEAILFSYREKNGFLQ